MKNPKKIRTRRWNRASPPSVALASRGEAIERDSKEASRAHSEGPRGERRPEPSEIARALLGWYQHAARDLPWRRSRDPYHVLLSEVMLQQTRVGTVLRYYDAFLAAFPSVAALAVADEEEVLACWSGLGYSQRARRLHAAAREVIRRGGVPEDAKALEELPGIGAYTAAAVASIAFGEVVPVLDGNVERVLCRVLGCMEDPRRAAVRRELRELAQTWLDARRPGCSNQALMELGSLLCTPRAPACASCPLQPSCWAYHHDSVETLPRRKAQRRRVRVRLLVAIVEQRGRLLLLRRSRQAEVLPGMWEFPTFEYESGEASRDNQPSADPTAALRQRLIGRFGSDFEQAGAAATFRHTITYRDLAVTVGRFRVRRRMQSEHRERPAEWIGEGGEGQQEVGWFRPCEIEKLPTSSLVAKALAVCSPP